MEKKNTMNEITMMDYPVLIFLLLLPHANENMHHCDDGNDIGFCQCATCGRSCC